MGLMKGLTNSVGLTQLDQANLIKAEQQKSFSSGLGTIESGNFKFNRTNDQAGIVDGANSQLNKIVQGGLAIDQGRLDNFKNAFVNERSPAMERSLAQQAQQRATTSAVGGTGGSSADLYSNAMGNMLANEQRSQLQNQAIQGSEALANTQLQQQMQQGGFYQGLAQQDVQNQMNTMNSLGSALNNENTTNLNFTNQRNQNEQARVDAINAADNAAFNNVAGLAMAATGTGGLGSIGGAIGGLFGGSTPPAAGAGGIPSIDYSSPETYYNSTPSSNTNPFAGLAYP